MALAEPSVGLSSEIRPVAGFTGHLLGITAPSMAISGSVAWTKLTGVISSHSLSPTIKLSSIKNQIKTGAKDSLTKCHLMVKGPASEQPCTPATFSPQGPVREKQQDVMVRRVDSGTRLPGFTSWLLCSLPVFYSNPTLPHLHSGDHDSKNTQGCVRIKVFIYVQLLERGSAA